MSAVPEPKEKGSPERPKNRPVYLSDEQRVGDSDVTSRIIALLTADDFALLELVAHCSFVGDTAAIVSKGILEVLEYPESTGIAELFIARIFRARSMEYCIHGLIQC